jgi:hypothetical protein
MCGVGVVVIPEPPPELEPPPASFPLEEGCVPPLLPPLLPPLDDPPDDPPEAEGVVDASSPEGCAVPPELVEPPPKFDPVVPAPCCAPFPHATAAPPNETAILANASHTLDFRVMGTLRDLPLPECRRARD